MLPSVLTRPPQSLDTSDLDSWRVADLRRLAGTWLERGRGAKMPAEALVAELKRAIADVANAARIWENLSTADRAVLGVYARHGTLDGCVAFLELRTRGLIRLVPDRWSTERLERNPLRSLRDRWVLLPERGRAGYDYFGYGVASEFPTLGVADVLLPHTTPAGPPTWAFRPAKGDAESLLLRRPALVALGLARTYATLSAGLKIRLNRSGEISLPSVRTLEKALALPNDPEFPFPDAGGFWFEMLRSAGLLAIDDGQVKGDEAAAGELFSLPEAEQAWRWARAWLGVRNWSDGEGVRPHSPYASERSPNQRRHVLAWALGCLARAEEGTWFELQTFMDELHGALGPFARTYGIYGDYAWDPQLSAGGGKEGTPGHDHLRTYWYTGVAPWYANALMITLPELGLVERGRPGGQSGAWCFRLTPVGRAAFGAPEVEPPEPAADPRFLVVQPNFDVVAYLDQADAGSASALGRIAEADAKQAGPVQTFRLTHAAVYRALEGGMMPEAVVGFLREHNRGDLPANVLRSLAEWSAQRERLVVRSGVMLRAFPGPAERDRWLKDHEGHAIGDRFVRLATVPRGGRAGGLTVVDHCGGTRRTFALDEHGVLRSAEPIDLLQTARLRRLAAPTADGWRLTADTLAAAQQTGLRRSQIHLWLTSLLREPMPRAMELAINAWTGAEIEAQLADAVVLHVPDSAAFEALADSVRLREFIVGVPGPGWFLVRKDGRKAVQALLEELGLTVGKEVKLGGSVETDNRPPPRFV
jgi:hypothetical protein